MIDTTSVVVGPDAARCRAPRPRRSPAPTGTAHRPPRRRRRVPRRPAVRRRRRTTGTSPTGCSAPPSRTPPAPSSTASTAIGGRHVVTLHDVPPADGTTAIAAGPPPTVGSPRGCRRRRRGQRARAPAAGRGRHRCATCDVIPLAVVAARRRPRASPCRRRRDRPHGRRPRVHLPGQGPRRRARRVRRAARRRRRRRPRPAERRARATSSTTLRAIGRRLDRRAPRHRVPRRRPTWPPPSTPSTCRSCRPATCRRRRRSARGSPPGADRSSPPTTTARELAAIDARPRHAVRAARSWRRRLRRALARPGVDATHRRPSRPSSRLDAVAAAHVRAVPAGRRSERRRRPHPIEHAGRFWVPHNRWDLVAERVERGRRRTRRGRRAVLRAAGRRCSGCTPRWPASTPRCFELVVADDGSARAGAAAADRLPAAHHDPCARTTGAADPARPATSPCAATDADVLVFLDADTVPAAGTVARLAAWPSRRSPTRWSSAGAATSTSPAGRRRRPSSWLAGRRSAATASARPGVARRRLPAQPRPARRRRSQLPLRHLGRHVVPPVAVGRHRRVRRQPRRVRRRRLGVRLPRVQQRRRRWSTTRRAVAWHDEPDWSERDGGSKNDETLWLAGSSPNR